MMPATMKWLLLLVMFMLGGCATVPTGPSVMVLPGTGKNFEQFHSDDYMCRYFALEQVGGVAPSQAATRDGVVSAVTGTAIGAATGAILGGNRGAAVGAGAGLLVGSMAGSETAQRSTYYSQRRYDNAYIQCMYANGHLVPMSGRMQHMRTREVVEDSPPPPSRILTSPPPGTTILPPPPGPPPPPPPGM